MGDTLNLSTNEHSVARIAIVWEMTKYIIQRDNASIAANKVVDLFNLVSRTLNSDNLMDQEAFKKLHE